MRVLHVHSGNMYGGVETFLATLARESAATPGMRSSFALCFEGRLSEELSALGHEPYLLGGARISRPHTVLRARRALRDLLAREAFDIVVCHQPWTAVVLGSEARREGLPMVLWVHMVTDRRHWLNRLAHLAVPDLVLCNSRHTASSVLDWFPTTPVDYVHVPVSEPAVALSASSRQVLRRSLTTRESDVVIAHVGRLEELKGHRVLLAALAALGLPAWTCWIVGGSQRPAEQRYLDGLQSMARDLGIGDRVRFLGQRTDVSAVLQAADVYCQPNTAPEGFGLTFVEAMRVGLPVVTTGIGGACEVVDGNCGVLTAPADTAALSRGLRRLIVDTDFRERLGDQARRRSTALCHPGRQMARIQSVLGSLQRAAADSELVGAQLR